MNDNNTHLNLESFVIDFVLVFSFFFVYDIVLKRVELFILSVQRENATKSGENEQVSMNLNWFFPIITSPNLIIEI